MHKNKDVAPLAGAWIEIIVTMPLLNNALVAPLAGAWIEIEAQRIKIKQTLSLLSRERGLKSEEPYD